MKFLSWNIENLAPWMEPGVLDAHLASLGHPDVVCLQEVRLRPQDGDALALLPSLLPGYTSAHSLCDDPRNVTFRGGRAHGVVTFVRSTLRSLSSAPRWDREGRVLVTALPDEHLAIVNLYAVNGTDKAYVDPDTGAPLGTRHEHKQRFQERVMDLADELATAADVIIAGDWNVSLTALDVTPRLRTGEPHATARAKLSERFAQSGWVDILRQREPTARRYSWFGRTRTGGLDAARVDYFVVSPGLVPRVRTTAILDERSARRKSDHAPLVLELARGPQ